MTNSTANWIDISDIAEDRLYTVYQEKWKPAKVAIFFALIAFMVVMLTIILANSNDRSPGGVGIIVIPLVVVSIFLILGAIAAILVLIPISLSIKQCVSFIVASERIILRSKNSRNYPDSINIREISHIYHGSRGAPSGGIVHVAPAGSAAGVGMALGGLAGVFLSGRTSAVWVNFRGHDVYLARYISESEAEFLFNDINSILNFQ